MRILRYSAENPNIHSDRIWLVGFVLTLGCVAWPPAVAFSETSDSKRMTEIRFASRLHREVDSQLGWEFPLWMDDDSALAGNNFPVGNSQCQSELSHLPSTPPVEVISVDCQELSRLEWEIIRSLREIHRLTEQQAVSAFLGELPERQADNQSGNAIVWWDYAQVLAQVQIGREQWRKLVEQIEQQFQGLQLPIVPQNWTGTDFWLGFDLVRVSRPQVPAPLDRKAIRLTGIAAKFAGGGPDKQFRLVSPQVGELAPMREFHPSTNDKPDQGPTSLLPVTPLERPLYQEVFSWLDSERFLDIWNSWQQQYSVRTAAWVQERWAGVDLARLSERLWPLGETEVEPTIQPIPTASYVGLKPAILSLQRYFSDRGAGIGELGQQFAKSIPRLPTAQNGAFERLVLEQIDAMRR